LQTIPSTIDGFKITPLSDRSVLLSFGNIVDPAINERVLVLHKALSQSPFEGFVESVPAYASLAVFYDVKKIRIHTSSTAFAYVKKHLQDLLEQGTQVNDLTTRLLKIPVCYDTDLGMDITDVAKMRGLTIDEIISLHSAVIYRVYMIGFMPGFAYMGAVDEKIIAPRKERPRLLVPAGSVGIAGSQTGIYPVDSPGGWQIIGKTPLSLFDTRRADPCLLAAGDQVQFFPIDRNKFEQLYGH